MDAGTGKTAAGLARYAVAATLVRAADAGAVVGLVLLAVDPARRAGAGPTVAGLLAAALTAPHLIGPWIAHQLDRARDGRALLAWSYLLYAVALAVGSVSVGRAPAAVSILAVGVAGSCGPLLTGGLSSRLAGIAGPGERAQRRAQGWDAVTYGVGGTAGPAVVAASSAVTGPQAALLGLCAGAAIAAGLTLTLPPARSAASTTGVTDPVLGVRAGLGLLWTSGPLRRVTTMTMLGALGMGALPLAAVALGSSLAGRAGAGATLTMAAGAGGLVGSLAVTIFPIRGEPDLLARRLFAALTVVIVGCALAPTFVLSVTGFALIGVGNATSFTATLAARSTYAPPAARAQVFVTSAGLKVAMSSAGSAVAGIGIGAGFGGRTLLLVAAAATGIGVLIAVGDRLFERRGDQIPHHHERAKSPTRGR
ncbi:MAG TPA: hypothetical protein VLL08_28010 [Kineosporiaceae bacterium]|nr:hypothetical protein [Kineosporiaceae bacterium]